VNKFEQFQKKKTILRKITSARMDAGISMRAASQMTQKSGSGKHLVGRWHKGEQLSPSAWSLIESGKRWPTWDSLFLMAKTLGLDIRVEVTSRDR